MAWRWTQPNNHPTHEILVTLAERPYPFPSRTRKSSSPAPKILRGQPFGKIGRRQDFCVSGDVSLWPRSALRSPSLRVVRHAESGRSSGPAGRLPAMTAPADPQAASDPESGAPATPAAPTEGERHDGRSAREAVAAICPYLTSVGGSWRNAVPS